MKIEWENLSNCLTDMDKKLLESQVKQLAHSWEQVKQLAQKKYSQQAEEHEELTLLMRKIQDLDISLQQQQQALRLGLNSPEEEEGSARVVAVGTELQTIKHRFSAVKGQAEFQMKRIWGWGSTHLGCVLQTRESDRRAQEPFSTRTSHEVPPGRGSRALEEEATAGLGRGRGSLRPVTVSARGLRPHVWRRR